jgi:hypothetical protein
MITQNRVPLYRIYGRRSLLFFGAVCFLVLSCGQTHAANRAPGTKVMKAVRKYRHGYKRATAAAAQALAAQSSTDPGGSYDLDGPYQAHLRLILTLGDFEQLEKEAHDVRVSQARLKGGVWKLYSFYEGVSVPVEETNAGDSEWAAHFAAIQKWIDAYPKSATARIALANTYINYAWKARGNGYGDSVDAAAWNLFEQRIGLGESVLLDAARLKEKSPFWYEAMQNIALAQGWEKQKARKLFDEAVAVEPKYYHFYREYANYLLPKWYGEQGETQLFAQEVSTRLSEPDGPIIYFEIATLLACQCDKDRDSLAGMSWPLVKHGYAELERLYGPSNLKMNRFAYMSYLEADKSSAKGVFTTLGGYRDLSVWQTDESYKSAETWASAP